MRLDRSTALSACGRTRPGMQRRLRDDGDRACRMPGRVGMRQRDKRRRPQRELQPQTPSEARQFCRRARSGGWKVPRFRYRGHRRRAHHAFDLALAAERLDAASAPREVQAIRVAFGCRRLA